MRNWLLTSWDAVRTSLWLIPAVMAIVGLSLSIAMLRIDAGHGGEDSIRAWWLNSGGGEDARNLLSTLLTAVITMASLAFSVTALALTLAANVYCSRLIRIFRANLGTQIVLGLFTMTIVYCIAVLRSIHGAAEQAEVPHVSVTAGTLLGVICVLALLGFIQGIARGMNADEVIRRVRREMDDAIDCLPEGADANTLDGWAQAFPLNAEKIALPREGYVQAVDYEAMVSWAASHDRRVLLNFTPGDFVVDGDLRLAVHPPTGDPQNTRSEIGPFITSGNERTPTQDMEFAIRHLVEIAVRALSPGINDPFTAMAAVDRLRGGLSRLMNRKLPAKVLVDKSGNERVLRCGRSYGDICDVAFSQIRDAAGNHPAVLLHMLQSIERMADHLQTPHQRNALVRHADLIKDQADRADFITAEREAILKAHLKAQQDVGL